MILIFIVKLQITIRQRTAASHATTAGICCGLLSRLGWNPPASKRPGGRSSESLDRFKAFEQDGRRPAPCHEATRTRLGWLVARPSLAREQQHPTADEAQSALSQEKVPRAYQGAVRDYFDDLKK